MNKDYGSWSLTDLKSELKKRKAKVTGKKAVLVQRLEDYDKLFGPLVSAPESCFKITLPNAENFRDVTSDSRMPVLTEDDLKTFSTLSEREQKTTSENMYQDKFLLSCRSAQVDRDYFITAQCASEMRKNIAYNVTIKAKDHLVLESQCECAAGMGPYAQCKHIIVLLYGILDFTKNKSLKLKSSCTSKLQTFHHPSTSYTGNPVQAEDLILRFENTKMKEITMFDPRQSIEDAEKFTENFISLMANYSGEEKDIIPIAELRKPANKRSIYRDHDYLEKTAEENYFESLILSPEQIDDLKTKTERKGWLRNRIIRLQSSSFGKICCQKTEKHKLAKSLLQFIELQTPAIKHGIKYEGKAIENFEQVTGLSVTRCGIIVHPQYQFLGSTPDALVGSDEVLEVKCPYTARNKMISGDTVPYIYLCEETGNFKLNKSHNYYYQIQGQMFCSQRNMANFFIYTISDFCLIKVERDEDFIKNMIQQLQSFYDDYYKLALLNRFLYRNRNT